MVSVSCFFLITLNGVYVDKYIIIVEMLHIIVVLFCIGPIVPSRLVNKCMSAHLNANANVSFDSNAISKEHIQMQMQMFWGGIQMQTLWSHVCKCI